MKYLRLTLKAKILSLFGLTLRIFVALTWLVVLPMTEKAIYRERQVLLEAVMGPVFEYLEGLHAQEQKGQIGREEAQARALMAGQLQHMVEKYQGLNPGGREPADPGEPRAPRHA